MYSYIIGEITEITPMNITIESFGIGYLLLVANPYSFKLNDKLKLYVHQYIREDAHELYGFKNLDEKNLFLKLISVKGIGPKSALSILASGTVSDIAQAIENGNSSYLMKFPGIGQKASQQIILDLKGKINFTNDVVPNEDISSCEEALLALGYKRAEITKVLSKIDSKLSVDEMIKQALKLMLKQ